MSGGTLHSSNAMSLVVHNVPVYHVYVVPASRICMHARVKLQHSAVGHNVWGGGGGRLRTIVPGPRIVAAHVFACVHV